jgi:uncharacterized protein
MSRIDLVERYFSAVERGDLDTVRDIYSPDATIWHNGGFGEQTVSENIATLEVMCGGIAGLRYEILRREEVTDGVFQTHVLRGHLDDGRTVALEAAMFLVVKDDHIIRVEEYFDLDTAVGLLGAIGDLARQSRSHDQGPLTAL